MTVRTSLEGAVLRRLLALPESVQRRLGGRPIEIDGQRLSAESQLLVKLRERSPRPPYSHLPVSEARTALEEEAAAVRGRLAPVAEVRDLEAAGRPARLYVPERDGGALLVYFHGGGWVLGSLESHEQTCRFLAARGGIRVLSADYRLAPESKFPAAAEDALAAFEWAAQHAAELGADASRMAVGGDSAGGNLSAVVASTADPRPSAALLIYPVCDLSGKTESYRLFRDGYILTEEGMDWYRAHYLPDEEAARDPRASPLLADDLSGMPPTHLALAGFDPLRDEGIAFGRRLDEGGVDVEVAIHEGALHGFANMTGTARGAEAAMARAAEFLRRV